jgi:uncharacterized caspase-like protein
LTKIKEELGDHLRGKAGRNDTVIIFFAGHGTVEQDSSSPDSDGLEKYLCPVGADPSKLYSTAIPMEEIQRIFRRLDSERLIFIADTCYSGASGGRTIVSAGLRANLSDGFLERISRGKGRVILTASGPNEVSKEEDSLGHGVFTYCLLQALRGKGDIDQDGLITVDEAYHYLSKIVPKATGQKQHPVKKGEVEGQIILGRVK